MNASRLETGHRDDQGSEATDGIHVIAPGLQRFREHCRSQGALVLREQGALMLRRDTVVGGFSLCRDSRFMCSNFGIGRQTDSIGRPVGTHTDPRAVWARIEADWYRTATNTTPQMKPR